MIVGEPDPRCAQGLRIGYGIRLCPTCAVERGAGRWPEASARTTPLCGLVVRPFLWEVRVYRARTELWHRTGRSPDERARDRVEVEVYLQDVSDAACPHG